MAEEAHGPVQAGGVGVLDAFHLAHLLKWREGVVVVVVGGVVGQGETYRGGGSHVLVLVVNVVRYLTVCVAVVTVEAN